MCRVAGLVEVLSSCGVSVRDVDSSVNSDESTDVVSTELVSPHQVISLYYTNSALLLSTVLLMQPELSRCV